MSMADAKKSAKALFDAFNITTVLYVDDYFSVSGDDIIWAKNKTEIVRKYFSTITVSDEDIINDQIRQQWDSFDSFKKQEIATIIQKDTGEEIDNVILPEILQIIPGTSLRTLSPSEWQDNKNSFLQKKKNTLFLFDQDLKLTSGSSEPMDGINIIAEILKSDDVLCGLITQTVTQANCIEKRGELSQKYNISSDQFFIIPKEDLKNNKALFLYLLKLTILSKDFSFFKERINNILNDTVNISMSHIKDIHVEDFNHIIFEKPHNEGLWEPDMYFRIYSHYQRREFNKLVLPDSDLHTAISNIRSVRDISTEPLSYLIPPKVRAIQRDELYEEGDYLNKNHLPIELGDIFEMADSSRPNPRKFILLMQPCDLIIRNNGSRARDDKRIALFEIKSNKVKQYKSDFEDELTYFGESSEEQYYIKYKEAYLIKDYILDLCVYSSEGVSEYKSDYICDEHIRPTLKERYEKIQKAIKKTLQRYEEIKSEIKKRDDSNNERLLGKIIYPFFTDDLFCGEYKEKDGVFTITFNCKRISRFKFDRAAGLLTKYYSVLQRPAFDVDYGQL